MTTTEKARDWARNMSGLCLKLSVARLTSKKGSAWRGYYVSTGPGVDEC